MEPIEIASPLGSLRLRPEREDDRDFLFGLFCASRPPEWAFLPLDGALGAQLTQHQFAGQTLTYRTQFPKARFNIVELDGASIGRIVIDRPGNLVRIVDQALMPQFRNQGIGTAIMRALMSEAQSGGVPLRLAAASNNEAALRLYLRLGFAPVRATPTHCDLEWGRAAAPPPGGSSDGV